MSKLLNIIADKYRTIYLNIWEYIMSLYLLEKRREIEGLYKKLKFVREQLKTMVNINSEYSTYDNIGFLEFEEESLLTKILKLKSQT